MDREAWNAAVHEVTKSRTRLRDGTELSLLSCYMGLFSSCSAQASLVVEHRQALGHRLIFALHGFSCSAACGLLPDQGLNLCLLHWQADSLPLSHQEKPSSSSLPEVLSPLLGCLPPQTCCSLFCISG